MRFLLKEESYHQQAETIGVRDKKILQLLIQDARTPISVLAKKLHVSQSAVVQKINSLKRRGLLLSHVAYTNATLKHNREFYLYQLHTDLGQNTKEKNNELLKITGIAGILWYHGPFHIILVSVGRDPQEFIEEVNKSITIKKIHYRLLINNWFHPPHLFKEEPDKKITFKRNTPTINELDERILDAIENNPRGSLSELAKSAKSSTLTVKNKLKELKNNGALLGTSTYFNIWGLGFELISISFIVRGRKPTEKLLNILLAIPQVGNIWEFAHEWNINAVFFVKTQAEFNSIQQQLHKAVPEILETEIAVLVGWVGK